MHDVVIYHRGQQIVRRAYRVDISSKVQVYILHRNYLRVSSAAGAALYPEHRTERRLAQCCGRVFSYPAQSVGKTDGRGRLALAGWGRRYGRDQNEFTVLALCVRKVAQVDLGLIFPVAFEVVPAYAELFCYILNRAHAAALRDLKVSFSVH